MDTVTLGAALSIMKKMPDTAASSAAAAEDAADRAEAAAQTLEIDPTLTQAGQAADAKKTGDEIGELKSAYNSIYSVYVPVEQGYFAVVDGEKANSNTWCRAIDYIPTDIVLTTDMSVKMYLLAYNAKTGEYIGAWNGSEFTNGFASNALMEKVNMCDWITEYPGYKFRINFYGSDAQLTPEEVLNHLTVELSIRGLIETKQDIKSENLIGMDDFLYPVEGITENAKMIFSTEDGSNIGYGANGTQVNLEFYDANKQYLSFYGFPVNTPLRIVTINALVASAKYLKWANHPTKNIMLAFGDKLKPYVPYFMNLQNLTDIVTSEEANNVADHEDVKHDVYALKRHYNGTASDAENGFKAMFVSDIHHEAVRTTRMVDLLNSWGTAYFNIGINTGDTVSTLQTEGLAWYDDIIENSAIPVLNTVGNHDAWTALTGTLASQTDVYNMITTQVAGSTTIVQPENASTYGYNYYYKDVGDIRVIVLDCMYYDTTEQTWFEDVLNDAKTNALPVIACIHAPFATQYCELIDSAWNVGWFHRDSTVSNIALASAVQNFMEAGGTFVCWLMGHIHGDEIETLPNYGGQLCVCINSFSNRGTTVVKNPDKAEVNYDCLTFLTVDTTNKFVKFYRIGANIDTAGHKHSCFVWDYVNKRQVTEW